MAQGQRDAISLPPGIDDEAWVHAASMAELGVLTASLLHELRQPLFAIKAMAQLARAERGAKVERLDAILQQVGHIESLIRHYGGSTRQDEPEVLFDLNQPVLGAVEMLAHRVRKGRIQLDLELGAGALLVQGRELAIRQVVINLLSNAFDAVEERGTNQVIVRTGQVGDVVRLEVEDTGPGVPEEMRLRLFDPFVTTKPPGRGTGLGLYIARKLVQEARGDLRLAAPEHGGARFEVDLPRSIIAGEDDDTEEGDLGFR